ncbi:MAG: ComEC/Rec2 family competence protein [Pseudomonadota bacterium]
MTWQDVLAEQAGRALLWFVAAFGAGAAIYFGVPHEPSVSALTFACVAGSVALWQARDWALMPAILLAGVCFGFSLTGTRAHIVAAPKLVETYRGPVEGVVRSIDQSFSGAPRVWLTHPSIPNTRQPPPRHIRVTFSDATDVPARIGDRIQVDAVLSAPSPKSDPSGYDFQRAAWFMGLGAVGYSHSAPEVIGKSSGGVAIMIERTRRHLALYFDMVFEARVAGIVKALLIGDKSGIEKSDIDALRDANLAHLLAISGLHMGLMTALVFGIIRLPMVLFVRTVDARLTKKIAAAGALVIGVIYLALSGFGVATQRAFIMVGVMLLAIMCDRPAISLRSLGLSGLALLLFQPEMILHAGFQMSFAATSALIVGFEAFRPWLQTARNPIVNALIAIVISSLLAGLATAPVAAFHFNRVPFYGLPANLLTVPLMGLIIMPSLMAGLVFDLIHLGDPFFWIASQGILWILNVADHVSELQGSTTVVPSIMPASFALLAGGWTFIILWRGLWRWAGGLPIAASVLLALFSERPDILVSDKSGAVAIMTSEGRAVNRDRSSKFEIEQWLENDGLGQDQAGSAALWPSGMVSHFGNDIIVYSSSKKDGLWVDCLKGTIVIAPKFDTRLSGECTAITRPDLETYGAFAVWLKQDGPDIRPITPKSRLWSRQ